MREIICALALVACGPPAREPGTGGDDDDSSDALNGTEECPDGAELIYTIDQFSARLSRFDPTTKTFQDLGSLSCPTSGTPFSMSVDRHGSAWVLYTSGQLFRVAIANLTCTATSWTPHAGLRVFGMGFSSDEPGGSAETLFVGGGDTQMQSSYQLAKLDTGSMTATPIGPQTQLPEMTGTGDAQLWGFMPDATNARIVQFDKTNGAAITTFMEPQLAGTMTGYAFAHWGGDFWVFLIKNAETSTTVYQIDRQTGAIESSTPAPGRTIVGAGVSTCAPVVVL